MLYLLLKNKQTKNRLYDLYDFYHMCMYLCGRIRHAIRHSAGSIPAQEMHCLFYFEFIRNLYINNNNSVNTHRCLKRIFVCVHTFAMIVLSVFWNKRIKTTTFLHLCRDGIPSLLQSPSFPYIEGKTLRSFFKIKPSHVHAWKIKQSLTHTFFSFIKNSFILNRIATD